MALVERAAPATAGACSTVGVGGVAGGVTGSVNAEGTPTAVDPLQEVGYDIYSKSCWGSIC